jgi:predicted amidohydrolase
MKEEKNVSRRSFLKRSSVGIGAGIAGLSIGTLEAKAQEPVKNGSRKISVATIDLKGIWPIDTREARIRLVIERMNELAGLKPDLVCLPELFDTIWVGEKIKVSDVAEDEKIPGPVTSRIAEYAKKNNCYVVCPIYTKTNGYYYNSSVLIDRKGQIAGVYHKAHAVPSEILIKGKFGEGVSSGALNQPVIETDFGKVGMVICYDANWVDVWDNLKKQGAEVILFSSAYPGGRMLNHYALRNSSYIISSTGGDARIVDISGNDLASSGTFVRYAWANINLEKVNLSSWPTNGRLPEIFKKYGNDQLTIKLWEGNEVLTLESNNPRLRVKDVLNEFKIPSYEEELVRTKAVQDKYRL